MIVLAVTGHVLADGKEGEHASWAISAQSTVQDGKRLEAMLKKQEQNGRVGVEERSRAILAPNTSEWMFYDVSYLHLHLAPVLVAFSLSGRGSKA
jgi:hypothetical protein